MALLIVAVVAVILLVAGGYGVMQERAESNDEIRQLRAALATAASSEDIDKARAEGANDAMGGALTLTLEALDSYLPPKVTLKHAS